MLTKPKYWLKPHEYRENIQNTCQKCLSCVNGLCHNNPPIAYYDIKEQKLKTARPRVLNQGVYDVSCAAYRETLRA